MTPFKSQHTATKTSLSHSFNSKYGKGRNKMKTGMQSEVTDSRSVSSELVWTIEKRPKV